MGISAENVDKNDKQHKIAGMQQKQELLKSRRSRLDRVIKTSLKNAVEEKLNLQKQMNSGDSNELPAGKKIGNKRDSYVTREELR